MLKQSIILFFGMFFYSVMSAQKFTPDSLSLKTDTATLITICDCQDAFIQYGKEQYSILVEVKRVGKNSEEAIKLNDVYILRLGIHHKIYTKCFSIYQNDRYSASKCPHYEEGEELDRKMSAIQKELGMN